MFDEYQKYEWFFFKRNFKRIFKRKGFKRRLYIDMTYNNLMNIFVRHPKNKRKK